ncbi:MAG TPA: aminoglycoside phosphotransferase family protein [Segeticoccus sp.]|uniref:aminoglycoside phosphotransferase family protein n=1 Tax=Segeticoccus sp. TaxID=2706531 RepID=UPI002D7F056B|nr:aminoglycoside phosphotransferase family protein [Segeticoccus sp.]HET8599806.1 aminoglycoside phosphotransferase family protein [Segeticoccus sp.]
MKQFDEELAPDACLVTQLLRAQFPQLADHDVRPSQASGSSNFVFRVGEEWAVRLPRTDGYTADLLTEARWLPHLAPHLTVPVPEVLFLARPSGLFPRPWSIVRWIPGEPPERLDRGAQARLATSLGRFMRQLHRLDACDLDLDPHQWGYRAGEPVTEVIDRWADTAAEGLRDLFDPRQVKEAWRRLRRVPPASGPPCWIHTDLSSENLLVSGDGNLLGVLDFGGLSIGDRSVDLLYAWSMFDQEAREVVRRKAEADEATWLRARAWAFVGPGLLTIHDYRDCMPARTATLTAMVQAVAAEVGVSLR